MQTEETANDNILTMDAIQVAARFLGVFIVTFFMMAVFAPKNGDAGPYLVGVMAMWAVSLVLCVIAYLYRNKRRYRQAIVIEWLSPVLPLIIYMFAY